MIAETVYSFPYNARHQNDDILYLSDRVSGQTSLVFTRSSKIFIVTFKQGFIAIYEIKNKIVIYCGKLKRFQLICAFVTIFICALLSFSKSSEAMGTSHLPKQHSHQISLLQKNPYETIKSVPVVIKKDDRIKLTEKILPVALLKGRKIYLNDEVLKALRAGDLSDAYTAVVIFTLLVIMFSNMDQVDGFVPQMFKAICEYNAPSCGNNPFEISHQSIVSRNPGVRTGLEMMRSPSGLDAYKRGITYGETFLNADGKTFDIDGAYQAMLKMTKDAGNPNFSCSRERFQNLVTDVGEITIISIRETFSALKLESMGGVFDKCWRDPLVTDPSKKGADFIVSNGIHGITHLEIKGPVDSLIRYNQGRSANVEKQGKDLGEKTQKQINRWLSENWRSKRTMTMTVPESPDKVLIAVDFLDVSFGEQATIETNFNQGINHQANKKLQNPLKHIMFFNKKDR